MQAPKPVLLVEGARQVGKTRLVEQAMEKSDGPKIFLNLEQDAFLRSQIDSCVDFKEFQELLEDRLGFSKDVRSILCIDEAQESLTLGRHVRFMKEQWPRTTTILTGSSMTRLFRKGTRYPVGRVRRLVLRPFSFSA